MNESQEPGPRAKRGSPPVAGVVGMVSMLALVVTAVLMADFGNPATIVHSILCVVVTLLVEYCLFRGKLAVWSRLIGGLVVWLAVASIYQAFVGRTSLADLELVKYFGMLAVASVLAYGWLKLVGVRPANAHLRAICPRCGSDKIAYASKALIKIRCSDCGREWY